MMLQRQYFRGFLSDNLIIDFENIVHPFIYFLFTKAPVLGSNFHLAIVGKGCEELGWYGSG